MAHNPTINRRKLASSDHNPPNISNSKPTVKRQVNPSTTSTTTTTSAAASTVYNLTNHFSRLNPNPNTKTQKHPPPQKLIDTQLKTKTLSKSAVLEPTTQKVGKPEKRVALEIGKNEAMKKEEGGKNEKKVVVMRTIEKRRSFSDAQIELANFLITNSAKVAAADMPPCIQIHAIGFARKVKDSLEKFSSKNLALSLKKEFDGVYGPAWHCIVGTSFGSFVTHSVGGFLYFSLDQKLYVLLFKTSVQRAD